MPRLPRSVRSATAVAASLILVAFSTAEALADCGDLQHASVNGAWQVRVVTEPPDPGGQSGAFPVGHSAIDSIYLQTTCTSATACSVQLLSGPGGNGSFYSFNSGLTGPDSQYPLVKNGNVYSSSFPIGGIGGPNLPPCPPPHLHYNLELTVGTAQFDAASKSWNATVLTGSEDLPGLWTCSGGQGGLAGPMSHLALLMVRPGASFPPDPAHLPCTLQAAKPASVFILSTIATALPEPSQAFDTPAHVLTGALLTLVVVLFITFPAQLFNKTFEENYEEIKDIVRRRLRYLKFLAKRPAPSLPDGARNIFGFVVVLLLGAGLGSLNDPGFGFNRSSLSTYVGVVAAVLWGVLLGAAVGYAYRRARRRELANRLHGLPAGLAIAASCVLISRLTAFTPGYLYGVVCGVAFAHSLPKRENAHTVALGTVATLVAGVVAWLVWIPMHESAQTESGFLIVVFCNFLAAVFGGAVTGSVISLIPLDFMPGGKLYEWNRKIWAATFGIAVFVMIQVVLRPGTTRSGPASVVTAVMLFLVFGGASIWFRWYFARRHRSRAQAAA